MKTLYSTQNETDKNETSGIQECHLPKGHLPKAPGERRVAVRDV